jgi:hypothetical protein
MDDGDPTTAGFNKFERVLDDAVNKFYKENARGDAVIVNVDNDSDDDVIINVEDDSDAPPNAHEVPRGNFLLLPEGTSCALGGALELSSTFTMKSSSESLSTFTMAASPRDV